MAVLRRPVPRYSGVLVSAIIEIVRGSVRGFQRGGLLRGVWMVRALVNFELRQEHLAEAVLGNHSLHRVMDQFLRMLCANLLDRAILLAALPAGIGHESHDGFL